MFLGGLEVFDVSLLFSLVGMMILDVEGTIDINNFSSPESSVAEKAYTSIIPEGYRDKPYLKDVKDIKGLFGKLNSSQELIGKKQFGVPEDNASKEIWDSYYKTAGRPDKAEGYEFNDSTLPEGLKRDDKTVKAVKDLFHSAGVSSRTAKVIQEGYDKILIEAHGDRIKANEQQDVNFDNLASETFGDQKDKVLAAGKKLLEIHAPEKFKALIDKLPNEQLILMAGVLNDISKKYIKEDEIDGSGPKGDASLEDLRSEQKKIMASPAYQSSFHPEYEKAADRLKEIANEINKSAT